MMLDQNLHSPDQKTDTEVTPEGGKYELSVGFPIFVNSKPGIISSLGDDSEL